MQRWTGSDSDDRSKAYEDTLTLGILLCDYHGDVEDLADPRQQSAEWRSPVRIGQTRLGYLEHLLRGHDHRFEAVDGRACINIVGAYEREESGHRQNQKQTTYGIGSAHRRGRRRCGLG